MPDVDEIEAGFAAAGPRADELRRFGSLDAVDADELGALLRHAVAATPAGTNAYDAA